MQKLYKITLLAVFTCSMVATIFAQSPKEIPHLDKEGKATQLIVDGNPFLVLGGELNNSSTSSLDYMAPLWSKMASMNLNTVLGAVSWDLLEPEENTFDYTLVDDMLRGARSKKLHLILLWFGSYKSGLSHYAPLWVKSDFKRFPRVRLSNGKPTETITPFSSEARKADSKAFTALMNHLKNVDAVDRTVIMVQVENEVGILGDSRDHSELASAAFNQQVPSGLINNLSQNKNELKPFLKKLWTDAGSKTSGTWQQVFGKTISTDEVFMAWSFAIYINSVAGSGKAEYPVPMFVNAWIVQPEERTPGDYPSGGPQSHVHDVWKAAAPKIDILSPDIYLPDFKAITSLYVSSSNPLFIPESYSDSIGAGNAFYAIGHSKAIGYSPSGIDNKVPGNNAILKAYQVLSDLAPDIIKAQSNGSIEGVLFTRKDAEQSFSLGGYTILVTPRKSRRASEMSSSGYCIIINTMPDEFTIAGANIQVSFKAANQESQMVGFASVYEGTYENHKWKPGRKLNGDNIMQSYMMAEESAKNQTGTVARLEGNDPGVLKIKLYKFQ